MLVSTPPDHVSVSQGRLPKVPMTPNTRVQRNSRQPRRLRLESLEHRRVLAAVSLTPEGLLQINGDEQANQISLWSNHDGDALHVAIDGRHTEFRSARVSSIQIHAGRGDDAVRISDNVFQPVIIRGQAGNDRIAAGSGPTLIEGGDGDDLLSGGAATDILFGGAGDDRLYGGDSVDYLIGGAGNDVLRGGNGADWLFGDATNDYPEGAVDPVAYALRYANDNRGNDSLSGGRGNDVMLGGRGNDKMRGGQGDDVMLGGAGADRIDGGAGDDAILGDDHFGNGASDSDSVASLDAVDFGAASDIVRQFARASSVEPARVDPSQPTQPSYDDVIHGGRGNDVIIGMQGNDQLNGGVGDDVLHGGQGRDRLLGGDGRDLLVGGTGRDYFNGGKGRDIIQAMDSVVDYIFTDGFDDLTTDRNDVIAIT